jgi:hypothetical protein
VIAAIKKLILDKGAQDFAEYGIALAIIGTVAGFVALAIHTDVSTIWVNAQSIIHTAAL